MLCCICYGQKINDKGSFICYNCKEGVVCHICIKKYLLLCWEREQKGVCPVCSNPFKIFYHGQYLLNNEIILSRNDTDIAIIDYVIIAIVVCLLSIFLIVDGCCLFCK